MTRRRFAGLAVAAALVAAGCSNDDGGDVTDEPPAATDAADPPNPDPDSIAADPSAGCGTTVSSPGETEQDLGGRSSTVHVPAAHDGTTPVPLVVDFHGYSEGGPIHVVHSALGPFGDEQGFATITPDSGRPVPLWDVSLDGDDLRFVGDLLDDAEATLCLDRNRIFVTGLSNGAFLTSAVACVHADRVAAVAPVAGIRDLEGCAPERPVPIIAFHGTEDDFVRYDGGRGGAADDLPAPDGSGARLEDVRDEADSPVAGAPTPEITAAWAERNGCEPDPDEEQVAEDVARIAWPCPAGVEVVLYRIDGGGHTWPGSEFSAGIEPIVGPTTFSISANELMWAFFEAHPRAG